MPKKFSYDYVFQFFLDSGCYLLSNTYVGSESTLDFKCNCGNVDKIRFATFKDGARCKACARKKTVLALKKSIEYVKNIYLNNNCLLLENEYLNSRTKMLAICECGEKFLSCLYTVRQGKKCKKCGRQKILESRAKTLAADQEYVIKILEEQGCRLAGDFVNYKIPFYYFCVCGSRVETSLVDFQNGIRCDNCELLKPRRNKYCLDNVKQIFEREGYVLLADRYKNNKTKMSVICGCGNKLMINLHDFMDGIRCPKCSYKRVALLCTLSQEEVAIQFASSGCKLLGTYISAVIPVKFECECGQIDEISLNGFQNGQRCHKCGYERLLNSISGANNYAWIVDRELAARNKSIRSKCSSLLGKMVYCNIYSVDGYSEQDVYNILGYTYNDLLNHLSAYPRWEQIKNKKWHLDHIFPIKAFLDNDILDVKLINCLENLQPLLAEENLKKSAKYNKEEFQKWLESKSVINYEI